MGRRGSTPPFSRIHMWTARPVAERVTDRTAWVGHGRALALLAQPFRAMSAGPHHEFNDAVSLMVLSDDQAELDRY